MSMESARLSTSLILLYLFICISAFAPFGPAAVARFARGAVPRDCRRSVRRVRVVDGGAAARALPEPGGDAHL